MADARQRHVVVFDVNIYLDVASLVQPPFTWEQFNQIAASLAGAPVPHPVDRAFDSLRAIAACTSGRFAGPEPLEVWTNDHIDKLVRSKASQSITPDPLTGYRGLGWPDNDAESLGESLLKDLVETSGGGALGGHYPDSNPPLDHEDGMVYGACRSLSSDDLLSHVYCVTRDRGFLDAAKRGDLSNHTRVMTPSTFVALTRSARAAYSIKQMRPPAH